MIISGSFLWSIVGGVGKLRRLCRNYFLTISTRRVLFAEVDDRSVGFLIGFMSPSSIDEAYIHFVGVDPANRSTSVGRHLYERFFDMARRHDRSKVVAITIAANDGSIAFHRRMGFDVGEPIDGYDRPGVTHVRFERRI